MIDEANRGEGSTMGRNDISGCSARVPRVGESATGSTSKPPPTTGQRDTGERTAMPAALARLGTRPVPGNPPDPADPATQRRSFSTKPKASPAPGVADSHDATAPGFAARRSPALTGQAVTVEHVPASAPAPVTLRQAFPVTDPDGPPMTVALRDYPGKPGVHLVVNPDGGPARFTATPRSDGKLLIAPLMKAAAHDEHGEHVPGTDPRDLSIRRSRPHSGSVRDEADPRFSAAHAEAHGSPNDPVTQRDRDVSACATFESESRAICTAAGIDKVDYRDFDALFETHDVKSIEDTDDVGDAEFACVTIKTGKEALLTEGVATCHSITLYGNNPAGETVMMSYHDGGDDNVLTRMARHMRDPRKMGGMPARPQHFMIVGGQFSPGGGDDANTITRERELLAESRRLNIPVRAARLHATTLEFDGHGNELENQRSRSVAVMSTATRIVYRDEDGSSEAGSPARSDD
jgi:hypothetical protein